MVEQMFPDFLNMSIWRPVMGNLENGVFTQSGMPVRQYGSPSNPFHITILKIGAK